MIIEFTGVPCSGKSDISHELSNLLREKGYTVCEKQYLRSHSAGRLQRYASKILLMLKYCFFHPRKAFNYYKIIGSKRVWLNYIYLKAHSCDKDFCILEQGYLQLIGSLFDDNKADNEKLQLLVQTLIPNDKIIQIFITASRDTILERARSREDKPFYVLSADEESALNNSFDLVNKLQEAWSKKISDSLIIVVSNDKKNSQADVAKTVLNEIINKELI